MPVFAARYIVSGGGVVDTSDAAAMREALGLGSASTVASTAFAAVSPATSTANTIQPANATSGNLILKARASQTAALLELHSSGGTVLLSTGTNAGVTISPPAHVTALTLDVPHTSTVPTIILHGSSTANVLHVRDSSDSTTIYMDAQHGTIAGWRLVSNIGSGTSPVVVSSTTACTSLNADLLDGSHAADIIAAASGGGGTIEQHVPLAAMYSTDRPPLLDWSTSGLTLPRARFTDGTEGTSTERLGFDIAIPSGAATTGNATISAAVAGLSASTGTIMLSIGSASVGGSTYAMARGTPVNVSSTVGNSVAATITVPMSDLGSPGQAKAGVVEITPAKPGDLRMWVATAQTTGSTLTNAAYSGTAAQMTISGATWTASSAPTLPWNTGNYVLSFDGVNDYCTKLLTGSDTSAAMSAGGFVRINATTAYATMIQFEPRNGGSTANMFMIDLSSTGRHPRFTAGSSVSPLVLTSTTALSTGTWYHVMGKTDGSNATLLVDGTVVGSGTHNPIVWAGAAAGYPTSARVFLGGQHYAAAQETPDGGYLNGLLSDIRHYKRNLSNGEVALLAASKHEDGLTAYTGGTLVGDGVLLSPGITIQYPGA